VWPQHDAHYFVLLADAAADAAATAAPLRFGPPMAWREAAALLALLPSRRHRRAGK